MRHREIHYEGEAGRIGEYDVRDLATFAGRTLDGVVDTMGETFGLTARQRAQLRKNWRVDLGSGTVEYLEIAPSTTDNPWFWASSTRQEWEALPPAGVIANVPLELLAEAAAA